MSSGQAAVTTRRLRRSGLVLAVAALVFAGPTGARAQTVEFAATPTVFPATGYVGANVEQSQTVAINVVAATAIRSMTIPIGFVSRPDFVLISQTGCVVDGTTVNPAGSVCYVTVHFTAVAAGLRTGSLIVTDGAGRTTAFGLAGTGYFSQIAITPSAAKIAIGLGPSVAALSGDGTAAILAAVNAPQGIAADSFGNVFLADAGNGVVRMLDAFGNVTTVAGGGTLAGAQADGGPATSAALLGPEWVAVDSAGNLYISESGRNVIRRVAMATDGTITTYAGTYSTGSFGDGAPRTIAMSNPQGLVFDPSGNLYIADMGRQRIRKVSADDSMMTVVAGTGTAGFNAGSTAALSAQFNGPIGLALDTAGNLYIADQDNHVVRELTGGNVVVFAGTGTRGTTGDGGPATAATMMSPQGLAVNAAGDVFVADLGGGIVRKVEASTGNIETVLGTAKDAGLYTSGVSVSTATRMSGPTGIGFDSLQNLYVADTGNNVVRVVAGAPGEVNFAAQSVGNTSGPATVEVANTGNIPVTIAAVNPAGNTATNFVVNNSGSGNCLGVVAPGSHCALTVAFAPQTTGYLGGELDLLDYPTGNFTTSTQPIYLLGAASTFNTLSIGPATIPNPAPGTAYSAVITATGTYGNITVQTSGTLPPGITSNISGNTVTLSGTATASGTYTFTVYASDPLGEKAAQVYTLTAGFPVLSVRVNEGITTADTPSELPSLSTTVNEFISTRDGSSQLPTLTLTVPEAISTKDAPSELPSLSVLVLEAISTTDAPAELPTLSLVVPEAISTLDSPLELPSLTLTVPEAISTHDSPTELPTLTVTVPEAVGVSDGPSELPTLSQMVNETITTSDSATPTPEAPLVFTPTAGSLAAGSVGLVYGQTITVLGGSTGLALQVSGPVPGLTLAISGTTVNITGTPTTVGTFSITVTATDSLGESATAVYGIAVAKQLEKITAPTIPSHTYGDAAFSVSATSTSGLPVAVAVLSGPAMLTGSTLDLTGAGTVTLRYTQGGNSTYSAASNADRTFTVGQAVATIVAANAGRAFETANPVFSYSVTGLVHGDTAASITGVPGLTTTAALNSVAGTYPITPTLGTLTAANYSFSFIPGTLTVSGGTAQTIAFAAIPNLSRSVGTLTMTAHSTSGLAVTYTVSGPASVSGNRVTLLGVGTVTVTAMQAGNGTFAAATSVSRSFQVTP